MVKNRRKMTSGGLFAENSILMVAKEIYVTFQTIFISSNKNISGDDHHPKFQKKDAMQLGHQNGFCSTTGSLQYLTGLTWIQLLIYVWDHWTPQRKGKKFIMQKYIVSSIMKNHDISVHWDSFEFTLKSEIQTSMHQTCELMVHSHDWQDDIFRVKPKKTSHWNI